MTANMKDTYRHVLVREVCTTPRCAELALVRCSKCGKTLCPSHATVGNCCPDCEMKYARLEWKVSTVTVGVYALGAAVGLSVLFMVLSPVLAVAGGAFAMMGGMFVNAASKGVARRLWLRSARQDQMVEGVSLPIAPQSDDVPEKVYRTISPSRHRPRGETPTPGWGMRTYGR
jgi:hypothetical protein